MTLLRGSTLVAWCLTPKISFLNLVQSCKDLSPSLPLFRRDRFTLLPLDMFLPTCESARPDVHEVMLGMNGCAFPAFSGHLHRTFRTISNAQVNHA